MNEMRLKLNLGVSIIYRHTLSLSKPVCFLSVYAVIRVMQQIGSHPD